MLPRIAVVEDEEALSVLLRYNLEAEGFEVDTINRGDEAEIRLQERLPDLLILDWMLPGVSGIELCRRLRQRSETERLPIIMLTARGEESERVRGLATGADDYVVKPFSTPELMARIKAVLRRTSPSSAGDMLSYADLSMDLGGHRVRRGNRDVHLGPTEFRLLRHFMQHPGRVFSREQLLDIVWGHDVYVEPRTVDVHIRRLRKALNDDSEIDLIRTVRSAGYSLDVQAQA
jgi:two-component system phosphate regulon response regulator PhoB